MWFQSFEWNPTMFFVSKWLHAPPLGHSQLINGIYDEHWTIPQWKINIGQYPVQFEFKLKNERFQWSVQLVVRKDYSEGDELKWLQSVHIFNILAYHKMVIDLKSLSPNMITWIVGILTERIKWTRMYQIIFHAHDHVRCVIKFKINVISLKTYLKFKIMQWNDLMKNIIWEYVGAVLSLMSRNHFDVRDT